MNKGCYLLLTALLSLDLGAQEVHPKNEIEIDIVLDAWHKAASEANFNDYFGLMTQEGVLLGTDATENWQNKAFREFSKPYFDRGRAWSFTALERNIYVNETNDFAWFDELLDTQMKLCRGSGVLKKVNSDWKMAHYDLITEEPSKYVDEIVELKKEKDSLLTEQLRKN